jgi:hypothetical protein
MYRCGAGVLGTHIESAILKHGARSLRGGFVDPIGRLAFAQIRCYSEMTQAHDEDSSPRR